MLPAQVDRHRSHSQIQSVQVGGSAWSESGAIRMGCFERTGGKPGLEGFGRAFREKG